MGTHDYSDDPRNADILISVNGELKPRGQAVVVVFDCLVEPEALVLNPGAEPVDCVQQTAVQVGLFEIRIRANRLV